MGSSNIIMALELPSGTYKVDGTWYKVLEVDGSNAVAKGAAVGDVKVKLNYGDFGEAHTTVVEKTEKSIYDVELCYHVGEDVHKEHGVLTNEGTTMTARSMMGAHNYEKITAQEAIEILEDGDSIEAPSTPYKIQPENQGRLLWFSGPPGLGKSTTAQLLAKNHGYVYYEADCFNSCKNPYVPLDAPDPTMAQMSQQNLIGEGKEQRMEMLTNLLKEMPKVMQGEVDILEFEEFYTMLCADILKEKQRIGGDWAVAQCVISRKMREFIRSKLDPNMVFVLLEMDFDETMDRLMKRHQNDDSQKEVMKAFNKLVQPAGANESGVITIKVTKEDTPEDVMEKVLMKLD